MSITSKLLKLTAAVAAIATLIYTRPNQDDNQLYEELKALNNTNTAVTLNIYPDVYPTTPVVLSFTQDNTQKVNSYLCTINNKKIEIQTDISLQDFERCLYGALQMVKKDYFSLEIKLESATTQDVGFGLIVNQSVTIITSNNVFEPTVGKESKFILKHNNGESYIIKIEQYFNSITGEINNPARYSMDIANGLDLDQFITKIVRETDQKFMERILQDTDAETAHQLTDLAISRTKNSIPTEFNEEFKQEVIQFLHQFPQPIVDREEVDRDYGGAFEMR